MSIEPLNDVCRACGGWDECTDWVSIKQPYNNGQVKQIGLILICFSIG